MPRDGAMGRQIPRSRRNTRVPRNYLLWTCRRSQCVEHTEVSRPEYRPPHQVEGVFDDQGHHRRREWRKWELSSLPNCSETLEGRRTHWRRAPWKFVSRPHSLTIWGGSARPQDARGDRPFRNLRPADPVARSSPFGELRRGGRSDVRELIQQVCETNRRRAHPALQYSSNRLDGTSSVEVF